MKGIIRRTLDIYLNNNCISHYTVVLNCYAECPDTVYCKGTIKDLLEKNIYLYGEPINEVIYTDYKKLNKDKVKIYFLYCIRSDDYVYGIKCDYTDQIEVYIKYSCEEVTMQKAIEILAPEEFCDFVSDIIKSGRLDSAIKSLYERGVLK